MSRQVIQLTTSTSPDALRAEIDRLANELEAKRADVSETEDQLAELRRMLEHAEAEAASAGPKLRETILAYAAVRGEITITQLRYLIPPDEAAPHIVERALQDLVREGKLKPTTETGIPAGGRGRAPRVYRLVLDPPVTNGRRKKGDHTPA